MDNKTIVLGRGYLGKEFERHGINVFDRNGFNVEYPENNITEQLEKLKSYDTIINCIGKSNTRWCEDSNNFSEALFINGELPRILSNFCSKNNIQFVHISTGCLYDNTTIENTETDFISAHCNYTVTKWVGEQGCNKETDLILRPRLYFSDIKDRNNLLCKIPVFTSYTADVADSFTCTSTIVGATKALLEAKQTGVFNVAQHGFATIANIAFYCGLNDDKINTAKELRAREGLYLVNNKMDIRKLMKFYNPMNIIDSIKLSYAELSK